MADGEACKHCGYQETDHDLGRARLPDGNECRDFESETHEEIVQRYQELKKTVAPAREPPN